MQDRPGYIAGIRQAYVGELAASRVYRALAERRDDAGERAKLAAIADVESRTAGVLDPVVRRLGITCDAGEIDKLVQCRVDELQAMPWSQFIEQALEAWPPYVERFAALCEQAPATDTPALTWLVAHERALIEFLHIERAEPHTRASLVPLDAYLAAAK